MKYPISPITERKKDGLWPLCYAEKLLKPQLSFSPPASEVIGKGDERKEEKNPGSFIQEELKGTGEEGGKRDQVLFIYFIL